jgi:thymidylate kinase
MGINRDAVNTGLAGTRWMERHREPLRKSAQSRAKSSLSGLAIVNRLVDQWYRLAVACFHRMRGRLVIFDRYVYDPRTGGRTLMAGRNLRQRWLRATAPIPDLVVLLDAPAQVLHQRKGEHTPDRLERMRSAYLGLREEFPQTIVVDATQDADTVRKTVIALIWRRMSGRSSSLHNSS